MKSHLGNSGPKSKSLMYWGSIFLIFSVLTSSIYLVSNYSSLGNTTSKAGVSENIENIQDDVWLTYKNELLNFSIEYPQTLIKREIGSGGGYAAFIRFEENGNNGFKGFAMGVSERSFGEETVRIKDIFQSEEAFLAEQETILVDGAKGVQFFYKPKDSSSGEERVITIFSKGQYTYSISTVPWQIEEVVGRFEFLD